MKKIIRKGRQWILYRERIGHDFIYTYSERMDGYWLFGWWAWAPSLKLLCYAIWYRLTTGQSNLFYEPARRERIGLEW